MDMVPIETAASKLRDLWHAAQEDMKSDPQLVAVLRARDEVLARYQPVFSKEGIPSLSEEVFRDFLLFKNNRHWLSLQRKGPLICSDMARLREALLNLVDDSKPIEDRLNRLVPARGKAFVPHLGKAILTPILLIHAPDRYGVWNAVSEEAMRGLNVWPEPPPNLGLGDRYKRVNEVILKVAAQIGVDLWTLDSLWWRVVAPREGGDSEVASEISEPASGVSASASAGVWRFGLERHLHDFLRDNWDHTELGKTWRLYEEDGDPEAGYEYPTNIGRIDLLARHRKEPRWLVIELKRDQTSDQTVGQVQRYMGWVKRHLAGPVEAVEGLIIALEPDESLRYALAVAPNVGMQLYEIEFRLRDAPA